MTKKGQPEVVQWNGICQQAFESLQNHFTGTLADPEKPFILQTESSDQGLGTVLSQADDGGIEHLVAYVNRKLLPWEQKYSTIENESLTIVCALKIFHTYLYGIKFTIKTDHSSR